jgi:hypothetical protein
MDLTEKILNNLAINFPNHEFEAKKFEESEKTKWKLFCDKKPLKVEWSRDKNVHGKLLPVQQEQADKYLVGIIRDEVKQQI